MSAAGDPGFYGKVPQLGDFVSRHLPRSFLDPLDEWLQGAIACSREQLGEGWLEVYLGSPVWRFATSQGLLGEPAWAGVMIPSVDSVGRYFPLLLGAALPPGAHPFAAAERGQAWYDGAEGLLLEVLEGESFDAEAFAGRVAALGRPEVVVAEGIDSEAPVPVEPLTGAWQFSTGGAGPGVHYPELLAQLARQRFGGYSLWWSSGSHFVYPSLLVCRGLPPPDGYAALLDGRWQQWSWDVWPALGVEAGTEEAGTEQDTEAAGGEGT